MSIQRPSTGSNFKNPSICEISHTFSYCSSVGHSHLMLPVFVCCEVEKVWIGSIARPDSSNEYFVVFVLDEDVLTKSVSVGLVTFVIINCRISYDHCV